MTKRSTICVFRPRIVLKNSSAVAPDNTASELTIKGGFVLIRWTITLTMLKQFIIIERKFMAAGKLKLIHPGEVLREEFLKPFGISAESLANSIGASVQIVSEILAKVLNTETANKAI